MKPRIRGTRAITTLPVVAAVGALLLSAACSGGGSGDAKSGNGFAASYDEIVKAAEKEPAVRVCSTLNQEEWKTFTAEFNKAYPNVKTPQWTDCRGTEPRQRVLNEYAAKQVRTDVADFSGDYLPQVVKGGYAAVPDWSVFKGTPIEVPERKIAPADPYKQAFVVVQSQVYVMAYNTDLVSAAEAPKSQRDCTDPKWKGQLIVDTRPLAYVPLYTAWGKDATAQWAKAIAANNPMWVRAGDEMVTLSKGEKKIDCGVVLNGPLDLQAQGGGQNLKIVFPAETVSQFSKIMMVAKDTPAPNASLLLNAWWASEQGEQALAKVNKAYGDPQDEKTWLGGELKTAGVQIVGLTWDNLATSKEASDTILNGWGKPQAGG